MPATRALGVISRGNGAGVPSPWQSFGDQQMSINWHELYAATMALALWGPQLRGKHLLFHCDNTSIVHIMAKASTRSKTTMALVHTFMLLAMQHNVQIHIQHITGSATT